MYAGGIHAGAGDSSVRISAKDFQPSLRHLALRVSCSKLVQPCWPYPVRYSTTFSLDSEPNAAPNTSMPSRVMMSPCRSVYIKQRSGRSASARRSASGKSAVRKEKATSYRRSGISEYPLFENYVTSMHAHLPDRQSAVVVPH